MVVHGGGWFLVYLAGWCRGGIRWSGTGGAGNRRRGGRRGTRRVDGGEGPAGKSPPEGDQGGGEPEAQHYASPAHRAGEEIAVRVGGVRRWT